VIPGHIEQGWELDAKADLAHARKYLQFFAEKVTYAKKKPGVDELYKTFKDAFPEAGMFLLSRASRYPLALMGFQIRTLTSSLAICRINLAKAERSGRRTSITMSVPGRRSSWRRITSLLDALCGQYAHKTASRHHTDSCRRPYPMIFHDSLKFESKNHYRTLICNRLGRDRLNASSCKFSRECG